MRPACGDCSKCIAGRPCENWSVVIVPAEDPDEVRRRDRARLDVDLPNLRDAGAWPEEDE